MKMTHKTITVNEINTFYWFNNRHQAVKKFKELENKGLNPVIAGKHAKSKFTFNDIRVAAFYQEKITGDEFSNKNFASWCVAYHD